MMRLDRFEKSKRGGTGWLRFAGMLGTASRMPEMESQA